MAGIQRHLTAFAVVAVLAMASVAGAQNGATNVKTEATLTPPEGATDTAPKGKARTLFNDNGQNSLQKLAITLQRLERRTDYRVAIDGIDLGVFAPKGNSGTLVLRFRTPPKGNQDAIPVELGDTPDFVLIEVFNDATGELVLTGTFAPVPED